MRILALAGVLVVLAAGRAAAQCDSFGDVDILTDGAGFEWDPQYDGNIEEGTVDAYDNGLLLEVDGVLFAPVMPGTETTELAGRQIVVGPQSLSGLNVTRRVYIPTTAAWARFLDTFENPGAADVSVTVRSVTNLGSDDTTVYFATSSGDTAFDTGDRWIASDDGPADEDPAMGHVFWGMGARVTPSAVSTTVYDCGGTEGLSVSFTLTVAAGAHVHLMYFASQNGDRSDTMASVTTLEVLGGPTLAGLVAADVAEIVNWQIDCSTRMEECNEADDDCDGVPDDMEVVCQDAGPPPDAGPPDAGPPPPDAGMDGGSRIDAGSTLDVHGSGVLCSAGAGGGRGALVPGAMLAAVALASRRRRRR